MGSASMRAPLLLLGLLLGAAVPKAWSEASIHTVSAMGWGIQPPCLMRCSCACSAARCRALKLPGLCSAILSGRR